VLRHVLLLLTLLTLPALSEAFKKAHPEIECEVSGMTENLLSSKDAQILAKKVKAHAPHCLYVNNPETGGAFIGGINEIHKGFSRAPKGPFNASMDGLDMFAINVAQWLRTYRNAEIWFLHIPQCNGKCSEGDSSPISRRRCYTTEALIERMIQLYLSELQRI
jgi:hypothetical protein